MKTTPTKTQRIVLGHALAGRPLDADCPPKRGPSGGRQASIYACVARGWLDLETWKITDAGRAALEQG